MNETISIDSAKEMLIPFVEESIMGTDRVAIFMLSSPDLKKEELEDGTWCIGFAEEGTEICMEGDTEEETLDAFWDYVYALISSLEKETAKLSKLANRQREFLRKHFVYSS